ncbi:MAG: diguanylate cyclase [Polyangiaceae bacterium]|nr:diguanylate cyclase [Polyangiaceae bacterium]
MGDWDSYDGDATGVFNLDEFERPELAGARDRHVLVRMDGSDVGHVTALTEGITTVGRHSRCNIVTNVEGVSRKHAEIELTPETCRIRDMKSANGTFVNGERVVRYKLKDQDVLRLGPRVSFRYQIADRAQEDMIRHLYETSVKDSLTGAYNREYFSERIKAEVAYAVRHKTPVSLIIFDIDFFKKVNDSYGHPAGDAVLISVVREMKPTMRTEDVFARYGGEEFAITLRGIDLAGCGLVAERLRQVVERSKVVADGNEIRVTISLGCASLECLPTPNVESMIATADRRLYAAKHGGRNQVCIKG